MFAPQQQGQGPQNDCMTTVTLWWDSVPFGTKFLFVSTTILYILDWPFNGIIVYLLADFPLFVFQGNVSRILFCQFVHGSIINLLFSLLSIYTCAVMLERNIGSITFLLDVCIKNVLVQIIYLMICFVVSFVIPKILVVPSFGLWNLAMIYISIRSFSQPEQDTQFLCFPVQIKNKYYPIAIVVLINLFAFPRLDILAACLLGYIEYRFFNGQLYRPTQSRVNSLANSFLFRTASARGDFVNYDGRLEINGGQQQSSFQANPINAPPQAPPVQQFSEFGGKGTKIGGDLPGQAPKVFPTATNYYQNSQELQEPTQQVIEVEDEQQTNAQRKPLQPKPKNQEYNQLGDELI